MNTDSESQHAASAEPESEPRPGARPPLRRAVHGRMLAGVAAGLARYFGVDVNIIRIGMAVLAILGIVGNSLAIGGIPLYLLGIPLYLACWLLIPEEGQEHSIVSHFTSSRQSESD